MMKKGISGHVLVIVISLIVAMIGLVLLWIFLQNTAKGGEVFASDIARSICELLKSRLGILGVGGGC